jgi:hypothetical protein
MESVRKIVVDKCRGKIWVSKDCQTEIQALGWLEFRLARLEDAQSENACSEEQGDTAQSIPAEVE